ncbi:hypothetical protein HHL17_20785 [Chitinophaga sp. G-6-1-13]|uniref:Fibronectin type-III domain-containing protein n=1 Tax=Chitinophaga fulva TaxID=2728842 RepID=A0A848GVA4_9BACT|nr:fibronectin type III domain-containing protein [Chitinophaga fulva]NML39648.1 hypothetical protein [Chitinophaga fulva]
MPNLFRYLLSYLLLICISQTAAAQQYPVTASTQIIPPYSVYLPDYVVPGSDKLRVILVQNDLTKPSYDVRLQMTVERNGTLIMRTAPAFTPRPLTLSAGVPTIISGTDLADYLNTSNIEFSGGFSRDSYERTRSLPEGSYRITFTAFDYRRPTVQVSNTGANIFFFQKNDPPLLNLPICGSRVEKRDPQFLTFSWSSRNTPNPLEGGGTEYIFSLYEIKPKNSNPDYIVRSTRPIYTITTDNTTIPYGPGEPALTDSMEYVWIVQARDKSGRDMFSNQGLSQSCRFTYLGNNPFETNKISKPKLSGEATGERTMKLQWAAAPASAAYRVETYRVQYRAVKKDGVEYDWQTSESPTDTALNVHSLEPGRSYEARLQWRVTGVYGPFSDVVTVTTKPLRTFTCGDPALLQAPQNNTPLPSAARGAIFRIGHFDVLVSDISGGDGVYSGRGKVVTPGFGGGMLVQFKQISVNTDMVVTRGEMQAVTEGIDKFISDEQKNQRGGDDVGQVKTGDVVPDIVTKLHLFTKESIKVNTEDGTITFTDSNTGQSETVNYKDKGKGLPLVIEDTDGNLYNVDKNGKVTSAGTRDKSLAGNPGALAALNTLDLSNGMFTFSGKNSKYAFDAWKDNYYGKPVLDSSYEKLADGRYRVAAKAILPGEQDQVIATLSGGKDIDTSKIKFVSGKGIVYPSSPSPEGFVITLTGGPAGDAQEIYAVYAKGGKNISMGKLLVASYAPKQKQVMLIPVGKATIQQEAVEKALKDAYEKIGVTYTVTVDESFRDNRAWDLNKDSLLQDSHSSFLGNGFTGEEKAMRKAYSKDHKIDNNTSYLFVVNEAALNDGDLQGKMPRQSQFGFIFAKGASVESIGRTVAHETGHGAYTLEHTFSAGIGLDIRSTDNLMDYSNGYSLLKYQWDVVHDPGHVWGIFENDQEQQQVSFGSVKVFEKFINKPSNTYTFLTPAGTKVTLPEDAANLSFSTLDRTFYKVKDKVDTNQPTEDLVPLGALLSFDVKQVRYAVNFSANRFNGYLNAEGSVYKDDVSKTLGADTGIAVFLGVKEGKFITYASRFKPKSPVNVSDFSVVDLNFLLDENSMREVLERKKVAGELMELDAFGLAFSSGTVAFRYKGKDGGSISSFLLDVLNEKSPVKDYMTFYTIANLKKEDLLAFADCLGEQWDMSLAEASLRKVVYGPTQGMDGGYKLYQTIREKTLAEMAKIADGKSMLLDVVHKAVQAKATAEVIRDLIKKNYSPCALMQLSLSDRSYILNQLLSPGMNNDYWYTDPAWYTSDDGHFILLDLFKTTPKTDRGALLKNGLMTNNYQWLRTLWEQALKKFNGVGYEDVRDVFDEINPWIAENFASLGIKPQVKQHYTGMFGLDSIPYCPGEQEYLVGFGSNSNPVLHYYEYSVKREGDATLSSNGKILLTQDYTMRNVYPTFSAAGSGYYSPEIPVSYDEVMDPFEPMTMMAVSNYHELGITAGDKYILPAYMAVVYNKDISRTTNDRRLRQVCDAMTVAAAILLAPESGGSSLSMIATAAARATQVVSRVSAIVSAADFAIQVEKNNLTPQAYALNRDFYEAWDKLKATVDYAALGLDGYNLSVWGTGKLKQLSRLSATGNSVRGTLDLTASSLKNLANTWQQLKTLTVAQASKLTFSIKNSKLFNKVTKAALQDNGLEAAADVTNIAEESIGAAFKMGMENGSFESDFIVYTPKPSPPKIPGYSAATTAVLVKQEGVDLTRRLAAEGILHAATSDAQISAKALEAEFGLVAKMKPAEFTEKLSVRVYVSAAKAAVNAEAEPEVMTAVMPDGQERIIYVTPGTAVDILNRRECKLCTRHSQEVCRKFERLLAKAPLRGAGVDKLCRELPAAKVNEVLNYLLDDKMNAADLDVFLDEIVATSEKQAHITSHVRDLNAGIMAAWKLVRQAKSSTSKNYEVDYPALDALRTAWTDTNFQTNVGGESGLKTALFANKGLPCGTCDNKPGAFIQPLKEYILDFKYFSDNYNFAGLWADLKQVNAIRTVYGAAYQLRILRALQGRFAGTLRFDRKLDGPDEDEAEEDALAVEEVAQGTRTKCKYDIKVMGAAGDHYFEFKSWGETTVRNFFNGGASKRKAFGRQMGAYLRKVQTLDHLNYMFDGRRMTHTKAKEIIRLTLREHFRKWYGSTEDNDGLGAARMQALFGLNEDDFADAVEDLNSPVYNFVKAE